VNTATIGQDPIINIALITAPRSIAKQEKKHAENTAKQKRTPSEISIA
jgi:hypothetical protein